MGHCGLSLSGLFEVRNCRLWCGVSVISWTAQASEPSESEDDEDKARFVCPFRVFWILHRKLGAGCLCADHRLGRRCHEGLRACCWCVLPLLDHCRLWHGGKSTRKHPCTWQDLAAARQVQKVAINELETLSGLWLEELKAGRSDEAKVLKQEVKEAEKKVEKAKQEVEKAKQEVEKAKEEAKASVGSGRGQAGASACAVVAVDFGLHAFSCGPPLLLFGVMLSSQQGSARR